MTVVILLLLFIFFWIWMPSSGSGGAGETGTGGGGGGSGRGIGSGKGDGSGKGSQGSGRGAGASDAAAGERGGTGKPVPAATTAACNAAPEKTVEKKPSPPQNIPSPAPVKATPGKAPDLSSWEKKDLTSSTIRTVSTHTNAMATEQTMATGGGSGKELGTGDVSFRMYWYPPQEDIDLHVIDPNGHHLWYSMKNCACNGILDRDDTFGGGPENIYWPKGKAPRGKYTVWGYYFRGSGDKTVIIEIRKDKEIIRQYRDTLRSREDKTQSYIFEFVSDSR